MQSCLFNFQSFLIALLLFICTCSYLRQLSEGCEKWMAENKHGLVRPPADDTDGLSRVSGVCYKASVLGAAGWWLMR